MKKDVTEFIGYEFPSFHFHVERGKIKEFALAIGDTNPLYINPEAAQAEGFKDVTIPPTFPTVMDMWGGADFFQLIQTLELNPLKVLHGEQEYEYFEDIYPGDTITGQTKVTHATTKSSGSGGMNIITLETVYSNQVGQKVLIGRSKIIERH